MGDHRTYALQIVHWTYATFWNTLWIIPGRTKQRLDYCVKVPDVRPLVGGPLLSRPINTTLPLRVLHEVLDTPTLPKYFQSVSKCCEHVRVVFRSFRMFMRRNSCSLFQGGNVRSLAF